MTAFPRQGFWLHPRERGVAGRRFNGVFATCAVDFRQPFGNTAAMSRPKMTSELPGCLIEEKWRSISYLLQVLTWDLYTLEPGFHQVKQFGITVAETPLAFPKNRIRLPSVFFRQNSHPFP